MAYDHPDDESENAQAIIDEIPTAENELFDVTDKIHAIRNDVDKLRENYDETKLSELGKSIEQEMRVI